MIEIEEQFRQALLNAEPFEGVAIPPELSVRDAERIIAEIRPPRRDEGRKDDAEKLPLHLLPPDALSEIARVLDFGARKYEPRNWERGMAWSRLYGALLRHMLAWWSGEQADRETGLPHLAHAACCVLFLLSYEKRNAGEDDRPPPLTLRE